MSVAEQPKRLGGLRTQSVAHVGKEAVCLCWSKAADAVTAPKRVATITAVKCMAVTDSVVKTEEALVA